MIGLLGAVIVASLLGSLHCAGMCGGLVVMCVTVEGQATQRQILPHALYHAGRLLSYTALGAVSGAIGSAIDLSGNVFGVNRLGAIVAGTLMVLLAAAIVLRAQGVLKTRSLPGPLGRAFEKSLRFAHALPPVQRAALIGLLTPLLPCGWLYAFVITATGTGSAFFGALTMAAFWIGTVPVLLLLGASVQKLSAPIRRHAPALAATALAFVGLATLFGRLSVPDLSTMATDWRAQPAAHVETTDDLSREVDRVQSLDQTELPCCDDQSHAGH